MRFHICIKQVPDVTASVDTGRMVLNAYDASAVEEALVLREKYGGEIHLVLIGPTSASETIRKALAMGADDATHIVCEDITEMDSRAFADVLSNHFRDTDFDVILCGKQAQDTDAGLTGGMLARLLDLPYVTNAVGLDLREGRLVVTRQGDSGRVVVEMETPCLATCSNDMNDPRIPSLKGIMAAKKKTIDAVPLASTPASAVVFDGYVDVAPRPAATVFEGEVQDAVSQLVDKLKNEAKVI